VRVALIVPAAGMGVRLGADMPKALVEISGRPTFCHALDRFSGIDAIAEVVIAVPAAYTDAFARALADGGWKRCCPRIVRGGTTRQESVALALAALRSPSEIVCIHDAVRPLVAQQTIEAVLRAAVDAGAATAASRPVDSVRQDTPTGGSRALERESLWLVETPQAFATELLLRAHGLAASRGFLGTDDAVLVEKLCHVEVRVVPGSGPNPKITSQFDLSVVERLLSTPQAT
jgi:2-C-methyl-D-erythritol 4-phosphate cytidylyltransferase